jgi:hypothetical protein
MLCIDVPASRTKGERVSSLEANKEDLEDKTKRDRMPMLGDDHEGCPENDKKNVARQLNKRKKRTHKTVKKATALRDSPASEPGGSRPKGKHTKSFPVKTKGPVVSSSARANNNAPQAA